MDVTSLANLATSMQQAQTASAANILVLKKMKESIEVTGEAMVEMMDSSGVGVNDGKSLDIKI